MDFLLQILIHGIVIISGIFIIGYFLPKERIAISEAFYKASPETVYNIVTNNEDYHYRSDLKEIIIIERNGDFEVWDEISNKKSVIRFNTAKKEPFSRYEMEMETSMFSGYWIGEFRETDDGGTHFITTEKINLPNAFFRFSNYMFFSLQTYMDTYKNDLRKKLGE